MTIDTHAVIQTQGLTLDEKSANYTKKIGQPLSPVLETAEFAVLVTNVVQVDDDGVKKAAQHIHQKMVSESYTPRIWRTHPLHICPPEPYNPSDLLTKATLDWIFLISSLNFSFWSEKEHEPDRYGVEWREGWHSEKRKVWTGYWSLVAALNRALEEDIPITDPVFYSSELLCPDSLIEHIFRPVVQSTEMMPLLKERIGIMRQVGFILCTSFGGSFQVFLEEFQRKHNNQGTALELVQMVTDTFPYFCDEILLESKRVFLWKRAQILVAETWAAFYPPSPITTPHPIFPGSRGPAIQHLTMFADYRVPQILHHLRILTYPPSLVQMLKAGTSLAPGSREEVSVRAASIVAVEKVRQEIAKMKDAELSGTEDLVCHQKEVVVEEAEEEEVSSVLIDFYLWDLAKKLEGGLDKIEGIETAEMLPTHRTRSIWY